MRQAGVIAAAGIVALEKMTGRLVEDHESAQRLARGLAEIRGVGVDPERVHTNIVVFDISATGMDTNLFSAVLKENGVLANGISLREMRMVTHKDVSRSDCETAVEVVRTILERR